MALPGWQAAFAVEVNGHWEPARVLPGVLALDQGRYSQIDAVSCPALHRCTAVGYFYGKNGALRLPLVTA